MVQQVVKDQKFAYSFLIEYWRVRTSYRFVTAICVPTTEIDPHWWWLSCAAEYQWSFYFYTFCYAWGTSYVFYRITHVAPGIAKCGNVELTWVIMTHEGNSKLDEHWQFSLHYSAVIRSWNKLLSYNVLINIYKFVLVPYIQNITVTFFRIQTFKSLPKSRNHKMCIFCAPLWFHFIVLLGPIFS